MCLGSVHIDLSHVNRLHIISLPKLHIPLTFKKSSAIQYLAIIKYYRDVNFGKLALASVNADYMQTIDMRQIKAHKS